MLIIAHRGASGEFPEGSQLAYQQALTQGADGFECDLRLTKDNQIICYHDSNTKRLSNIDLKIADMTFAQLAQSISPYPFEQLLKLALEYKKDLVIEFKHPVPTAGRIEKLTYKLLNKYKEQIIASRITITLISFSYLATLRNLINTRGLYKTGLLVNNRFYARIIPTNIAVVSIDLLRKYPYIIRRYRNQGKTIFVWTINSDHDLKLCKEFAVNAVITDFPKKIIDQLK